MTSHSGWKPGGMWKPNAQTKFWDPENPWKFDLMHPPEGTPPELLEAAWGSEEEDIPQETIDRIIEERLKEKRRLQAEQTEQS